MLYISLYLQSLAPKHLLKKMFLKPTDEQVNKQMNEWMNHSFNIFLALSWERRQASVEKQDSKEHICCPQQTWLLLAERWMEMAKGWDPDTHLILKARSDLLCLISSH